MRFVILPLMLLACVDSARPVECHEDRPCFAFSKANDCGDYNAFWSGIRDARDGREPFDGFDGAVDACYDYGFELGAQGR